MGGTRHVHCPTPRDMARESAPASPSQLVETGMLVGAPRQHSPSQLEETDMLVGAELDSPLASERGTAEEDDESATDERESLPQLASPEDADPLCEPERAEP